MNRTRVLEDLDRQQLIVMCAVCDEEIARVTMEIGEYAARRLGLDAMVTRHYRAHTGGAA